MGNKSGSIIGSKTFVFAVRVVKLYKILVEQKKEFVLAKQLLRSGTSIGANVREGLNAESEGDFIHKMGIAQKETSETIYWLDLLKETEYLKQTEFDSIITDANEILDYHYSAYAESRAVMKILFIVTTFNGMSQRAWIELDRLNHQVKVHIATSQKNMEEAVNAYAPDLIIAPFLKTAIPESIWSKHTCLIVHPGIPGDRGSSSLDWAILNHEMEWGVTILQAVAKMDAGPVWASETFEMRNVSKSFLYRHEVTRAAIKALLLAIQRFEGKDYIPKAGEEIIHLKQGKWNRASNQNDLRFSWNEDTASIIRKINAADSYPGALCKIFDDEYYSYGAVEEEMLKGEPGEILGKRDHAVCIAT
ncbi:MAG: four helix bundle protein, partial [Chitinophagaceae bacterium]